MAVDVGSEAPKHSLVFCDPPISKCKGRKKGPARWKIAAEKAPIKGRTCSYCGKMAKHNIRTCPKKIEDEGNGKIEEDNEDYEEEDEEEDDVEEEDD